VDALGIGIGFTMSLTILGAIRELLGAGNLFGIRMMSEQYQPFSFMVKAPGAFICMGLILGIMNAIDRKK
jgi:electron transport complex protein RnfE